FERTTSAAAAGGITAMVDVGTSKGSVASVSVLEEKRRAAEGHCAVDVGFCGRVTSGNTRELERLDEAGVFGFACTLASRAIENGDAVTEPDLRTAMPTLARRGATAMMTGELAEPVEKAIANRHWSTRMVERITQPFHGRPYSSFLEAHPKEAETAAILRLLDLCREYRTNTH